MCASTNTCHVQNNLENYFPIFTHKHEILKNVYEDQLNGITHVLIIVRVKQSQSFFLITLKKNIISLAYLQIQTS
jgi:hypothetical protein